MFHIGMRVARRLGLVSLLAAALGGCAALQIDVDVYKGPLANSDDTQHQQLASMALSAKPLIISFRNKLLDDVNPKWTEVEKPVVAESRQSNVPGISTRTVTAKLSLFKTVTLTVSATSEAKTITTVTTSVGAYRKDFIPWIVWDGLDALKISDVSPDVNRKRERVRQARQLNGILSFYKDKEKCETSELFSVEDCEKSASSESIGFFHGRPDKGIESLADKFSSATYALTKRSLLDSLTDRDASDYRALEAILVDFAARVQFYTNNQWIVENNVGLEETHQNLKILLETVSNTILVQADELRRSAKHATAQEARTEGELSAAQLAFAPKTAAQTYQSVLGAVDLLAKAAGETQGGVSSLASSEDPGKQLQAVVQGRKDKLWGTVGLAAVLATNPLKPKLDKLQAGLPPSFRGDVEVFKESYRSSLAAASVTMTAVEFRQSLGDWVTSTLTNRYSDVPPAIRNADPEFKVLGLMHAATQRLDGLDGVQKVSREKARESIRLAINRQLVVEAESLNASEKLKPVNGSGALAGTPIAEIGVNSRAELASVTLVLRAVQPEVIAAIGDKQGVSAKSLLEIIRTVLEKPKPGGGEWAARDDMNRVVAILKKISVPSATIGLAGSPKRPIDVADTVIAQLRNLHIEALRGGGKSSEEAKNLEAALEQAKKYRADMIHVRPSSAYLRSALPATFAQDNVKLKWTNMLDDTVRNLLGSAGNKSQLEKTREDLDKVFWQNINRVRLNAAGGTNYVVAKDDTGNWYVKGMGADPAAMVNAAKNLALFNMGGRLNSNLLRIDELQGRVDNDRDAGPEQRQEWRNEIIGLSSGSESGGAISERGETLGLFRASYNKATGEHFESLRKALSADTFKNQIIDKWQATASTALPTLTATMARQEIDKLFVEAQGIATSVSTMATADAIISALQSLEHYRVALRAAVLADTRLVTAPESSIKATENSLTTATAEAQTALTNLQTQGDNLSRTTAAWSTASSADPAVDPQLLAGRKEAMRAAAQANQDAAANYGQKVAVQAKYRADLETVKSELGSAVQKRARFAADVDAVLRRAIQDMVRKRLNAVQELETAANVVGRRSAN